MEGELMEQTRLQQRFIPKTAWALTNTNSNTSPKYYLLRHVHMCKTQDGVVFLDLRQDRYYRLPNAQAGLLARAVAGWPLQLIEGNESASAQYASRIAETLAERGLLTTACCLGKSAMPITIREEEKMIAVGQELTAEIRIKFKHLVKFLTACACAAYALRWRSFESIVERVATRKQRAIAGREFDTAMAVALTTIFRRMRSYAFSAKDACLFHTLALLNFLALYDVYPTWFIGVNTEPWGAHSWVQEGGLLFDCTPEEASNYTVILTI